MKNLLFIICLFLSISSYAQGPGVVFDYDGAGYRILREFDANASLSKPGKDSTGQQADTIIGYYAKEETNEILDERIFVRAYPNPVQNELYVENLSWQEGNSATLKLYDISGKLLLEKTTAQPKESIGMNSLPPGNYHVKYYTNYTYLISWKITKL